MNRWGLDLAFAVPGLSFDGSSLSKHSLGGSETAGLCLARELAAIGHHVTVFSHTDAPGKYDGVLYRNIKEFVDYGRSAPHDVTVIQRVAETFGARMNSRLNVLWCHALAVGRQGDVFRAAIWNIDKVAVVSGFMAKQYEEVYKAPPEIIWQTRNGIDTKDFRFDEPIQRDRTKLIFGARPERGLDVLIDLIFPTLLMKRSNLKLYIATYGNPVQHLQGFYQQIKAKADALGDSVVVLPPLTKREYYRHLASAGVYVYPTPSPTLPAFAEVSCISAMECMASGLPFVSSNRGALPETLAPGAGVLIDGEPRSDRYVEEFCDAVLRYVRDDGAWGTASAAGLRHAPKLDWAGVAEEWGEELTRSIIDRNDSPRRLVQHFIRRSDIQAAKVVIESMPPGEDATELRDIIQKSWNFAESKEGLQNQAETIGLTHTDVFSAVPMEPRFQLLEQWFQDHPEVERVLDFGCSHGGYAVNLSNRVGREWLGVDLDKHSIRWADHNRLNRAERPDSLEFRAGDSEIDLSDVKPFDLVVAFEVLEHVPDASIIDRLERWVKPDGLVLITVPYGPWEWMSYKTYPHRWHLWEYDLHDIRDLFGKKKNFRLSVINAGKCEALGEPLGWHLIEYRVDGTPSGTIDMQRKVTLQAPRQSLSVVMIGGAEAEKTLGWALESVQDVADEIILGDCGLTDLGRQIASKYGAKIVPAADPIVHGFETPRNDALSHARMDWVTWFDTDEKMVSASSMLKYLRKNVFTGYSIRQHNFSCDSPHEPTLPIRCFRRQLRADGRPMRWYGMIHEHQEYALNEGPGRTIILRDVHIAHLGYISGAVQIDRFNRNLPLLKRDMEVYPDRLLQKHFLCRDHMTLARWEAEASGGLLTPGIEAHCRRVIELYREHFIGKGNYLNIDSLQYYSMALKILGEGIEVAWSFAASKDTVEPTEPIRARFASIEEAEKELSWRIRHAMEPFTSEYW